jgi:hypothetical protein
VGVEKRLLEDAESFAKEVASLDHEGFVSRTLAGLGISRTASETISENGEVTPGAGRIQRPAPAGGHSSCCPRL